eukprot:1780171-Rhodomonas_salina.3
MSVSAFNLKFDFVSGGPGRLKHGSRSAVTSSLVKMALWFAAPQRSQHWHEPVSVAGSEISGRRGFNGDTLPTLSPLFA